jgi:hypothetical protein
VEGFDRDLASQQNVLGEIDASHPTPSYALEYLVAPIEQLT